MLISSSVTPFDFRKLTIALFFVLMLLCRVGRSFPISLKAKGQVTLSAGTSISAKPLTLTILAPCENSVSPEKIIYPKIIIPTEITNASLI